jgi:hypothetical protein
VKIFNQSILTGDWIYDFKHSDGSWKDKGFNHSRKELAFDDEYWQILKEFHVTVTPGNLLFRFGKQIISWGQTDGIRLMDQVNPADSRRGLADVEFENTIIPIWLARAEYFPQIDLYWLGNLCMQFWFNPNADFIPTQGIGYGNDVGGIWAPYLQVMPGVLLGSRTFNVKEPDRWSDEGHEFGIMVQGDVLGSIVSLNYFYGLDNDPIGLTKGLNFSPASDGVTLLHLDQEGYYPRMRLFGGTFTRDLQSLSNLMFGIAPVIRLEAFYAMDSSFTDTNATAVEYHDELRCAIGLDWKLRVPFINKAQGLLVSSQYFIRHISDLGGSETVTSTTGPIKQNNEAITLLVSTGYLNGKLTPSVFWWTDLTTQADLVKVSLKYKPTYEWAYTVGAVFVGGRNAGEGFELFDHKDYAFASISYRWG